MEEVVILGADGRPVKGMQLDRNTIHLGDANGGSYIFSVCDNENAKNNNLLCRKSWGNAS